MTRPIRNRQEPVIKMDVDVALAVPRTRADDVVRFVEETIKQRGLKAGDHIGTRADLRERTGVARATINEAIRLLQDRQTVSLRPGPGGGLFVAEPHPMIVLGRTLLSVHDDPDVAAGAIEMREQLEPLIARHAALHRTRGDIKDLKMHLTSLVRSRHDPQAFKASMVELHTRIGAISPNPVLRSSYISLYDYVNSVSAVKALPADSAYLDARLQVHRDLVDAIIAGDADAAESAGVAHGHRKRL